MNKREFDAEIKRLTDNISSAYQARTRITKEFQVNCPHQVRYLTVERVDQEDEYGKWIESWTTFTYRCSRCGAEIDRIKSGEIKTDNELRKRLTAQVAITI